MLRIVIDRTTDAMRAEVSSLYLLERREGILRLVATNGLNPRAVGRATLRLGEGITGWVANARVPLTVRDVHHEPRWKFVPTVDVDRFTSMLSVPLVSRDEVIGVMNVQTVQPRDFDRAEIDFLQTIANQVAGIIDKGRLQREAERKLREVSALFEVQRRRQHVRDLEERRDLAQLALGLALQAALVDDPRDLIRDRLQEIDLRAIEVARLHRLHVHHSDDLVARDERHGEHRGETVDVDRRHELPARLVMHVADGEWNAGVGDPPGDPLPQAECRASDRARVQAVRRHQAQDALAPLE